MDEKVCNVRPCAPGETKEQTPKYMDGSPVNHAPDLTVKSLAQSVLFKRVTNRYQRFRECELREGDICIVRDDLSVSFDKFGEIPKLPGWAVLNVRTFNV